MYTHTYKHTDICIYIYTYIYQGWGVYYKGERINDKHADEGREQSLESYVLCWHQGFTVSDRSDSHDDILATC